MSFIWAEFWHNQKGLGVPHGRAPSRGFGKGEGWATTQKGKRGGDFQEIGNPKRLVYLGDVREL